MDSDGPLDGVSRAARLLRAERALVVGHRGFSSVAPENTLAAFEQALDLGVDMVEFDYHHTADGVPVVIHDPTLDRTTDAVARWGRSGIAVAQTPLAELTSLDVGGWFHSRYAGERVATVRDALAAIIPRAVAMIERKAGDAATLIALLAEENWFGDVVVQSFDWHFISECKRLAPALVTGALGRHDMTEEALDEAAASGASFIGWANPDVSREGIARAKKRGLRVFVFTVDEAARGLELIAWGVDGVISNVPQGIGGALGRRLG